MPLTRAQRKTMLDFINNHDVYESIGLACRLKLPAALSREDLEKAGFAQLIQSFITYTADNCIDTYSADVTGDYPKYLVLYDGGSTRKTHCYSCGLWTRYEDGHPCTETYCEGRLQVPIAQHELYGTRHASDDWDDEDLISFMNAIVAFDKLAQDCDNAWAQTLITAP